MAAKKIAEAKPIDLKSVNPYTIEEFADLLKVGKKHAEKIIRIHKVQTCTVFGKRRIARAVAHAFLQANSEGETGF